MYAQLIRESLARLGMVGMYDPAAVEAWMRVEHSTLDHLFASEFDTEVLVACECIDASRPDDTAALAASYGLMLVGTR